MFVLRTPRIMLDRTTHWQRGLAFALLMRACRYAMALGTLLSATAIRFTLRVVWERT